MAPMSPAPPHPHVVVPSPRLPRRNRMEPQRITRRRLIRSSITFALGTPLLLAACGGGAAVAPAPTTAPAGAAKPAAPAPTTAAPASAAKSAATTAPAGAASQPAPKPGPGTVVWFHRVSPLENKWQDAVLPAYQKVDSKTTIQRITIPGAEYNAKLLTLQAAGETPNIFGFSAVATWWGRGLIVPIDDFLNKEKGLAEQFFPNMFNTYVWWGKKWGMPMAPRFGTMTFYNRDLFDKAGVPYPKIDFTLKDWNADVMLEKAQKLTTNYGKPNVVFGINYG